MREPTQREADRNGSLVVRQRADDGRGERKEAERPGNDPSSGENVLHAVVIGVDHHDPGRGPDYRVIPTLSGAVSDALRVERYLRSDPFALPVAGVRTLISPSPFSEVPRPDAADLPTYANIVRELSDLRETASAGDQVLIHFSGHGVRVPSFTRVKGRSAWDEALVPCDAGSPDGGLLRDVVMYHWLARLADAGLYVTLLLDACFAGGATRDFSPTPGADDFHHAVRVRGLGERGGAWGPRESPSGSWEELYREAEASMPTRFRPGFRHFAGESGWFPQPPGCVLLAACRRTERAREQPWDADDSGGAFTRCVLDGFDSLGDEISYTTLLHAVRRRIHGLWRDQTPVLEGDGGLRVLGGGERLGDGDRTADLEGRLRVRCRVGIDASDEDGEVELRAVLASAAPSRVELVPDDAGRAELLLGTVAGPAIELRDPFGTPLVGVGEPIPLTEPDAARELGRRLEHLALYDRTLHLTHSSGSSRCRSLHLGLFEVERKEDWSDPAARRPLRADRVPAGLLVCLLLRNTSEWPLNAIVLDLRPEWSIECVHPPADEGEFAVLEPGSDHPVFLRTWLPDGSDEARSVLKVIASVDPITADRFVLPALEATGGSSRLRSTAPTEAPHPPGELWTTSRLELTVVR